MEELMGSAKSTYQKLIELERELDYKISRKQTQIADAAFKVFKVKRTLRIVISHTTENQGITWGGDETTGNGGAGSSAAPPSEPPSWTLRVEGRLEGPNARANRAPSKPFSHYIRSLVVEMQPTQKENANAISHVTSAMDDDGSPAGEANSMAPSTTATTTTTAAATPASLNQVGLVEWVKGPGTAETEGFEIHRTGNRDITCKIVIRLDEQPERFRPSPELSTILIDRDLVSKPAAVLAIWQYVKVHKLQESDEKKQVRCDSTLERLFGAPSVSFSEIPRKLEPHLLPPEPLVLEYIVRMDLGAEGGSAAWDWELDVDDPSKVRPMAAAVVAQQREIGMLEHRLHDVGTALRAAAIHERLLRAFAEDPVGCMQRLMDAQCADQEIAAGEPPITVDDVSRSANFDNEDVERAISLFCSSLAAARSQK